MVWCHIHKDEHSPQGRECVELARQKTLDLLNFQLETSRRRAKHMKSLYEGLCDSLIDKFESMFIDADDIWEGVEGLESEGWNDALTEVIIHLHKVKEERDAQRNHRVDERAVEKVQAVAQAPVST